MLDRTFALQRYRGLARGYDAVTRRIGRKRQQAIELLQLQPGEAGIEAARGDQPGMRSFLDDTAGVEDQDPIA